LLESTLWPFIVYFGAVLGLVAVMIGGSYLLGNRHKERATDQPFESGIIPTGTARLRFDVRFYLIAVFFVIFDLEALFIFAWALDVRNLGIRGYLAVLVFIGVLFAALVYLWRVGALEMRTPKQKAHG
jgi:NADH-quinone oxidoreductase subunit A